MITVLDPGLGDVVGEVVETRPEQLAAVVDTAQSASREWLTVGVEERRTILREMTRILRPHAESLATTLTREQGKPLAEARAEIAISTGWFESLAGVSIESDSGRELPHLKAEVARRSVGVVGCISPANFPVILSVVKLAASLLAGNAAVVKPAPETPLAISKLINLISPLAPEGLVSVVHGGGDLGVAMVECRGIDRISYTGSTMAGRDVAVRAAQRLMPVTLELGGNDAAILMPGISDEAVERVARAALVNAGQFCCAVKRVYVSECDEQRVADGIQAYLDTLSMGHGLDANTTLGPLTKAGQVRVLNELLTDSELRAARLSKAVQVPDQGNFFAPRVVQKLPDGSPLELQEQFGPVIPVMTYRTVDEAVARANSTDFGLGGSVWGEGAPQIADRLDCGIRWIDSHGLLGHTVPFAGRKNSGIGVEYDTAGIEEFRQFHVTVRSR